MAKKKPIQRKTTRKKADRATVAEAGKENQAPTKKGARDDKSPTRKSSGKRQSLRDDELASEARQEGFPIVGIGASAGGLAALRRLLEAMPDEPGMALVVVQHLDPTRKSLAPELLAKCTKMSVAQVTDDPHVKPNRVYVIPPDKYLSISEGELHLSEPDRPRGARMAIDFFLRSLAKDQHQRGVGVVLSGSGTDGTLGIKAFKAAGGLVLAQDPATAEHPGMPRSAIHSGVVDHILSPEAMPGVLVGYARHPYVREGLAAASPEAEPPLVGPDGGQGFDAIIALLRTRTKHDFRNYKDKTLVRRTRRRMCLHHIDEYDEYLTYLREHPQEIEALAKDMLIAVTDFFREPEAWEALRQLAIRPLVDATDTDEQVRVWTPGCATGEEPYSVAMLILDELKRVGKNCPLNVFASDVDKHALEYARAGRYPKSIEADVPLERLQRFFTAADGEDYYHVNKVLRESVVFADQNLIADPPFSRLDLVCCRNLLIYLKADVQEKIIALFHFALREGGVLFLGNAETIGHQSDLFETMHKRWRIFRRVGPTRHDRVDIPISDTPRRREIDVQPAPPRGREARLTHLAQQHLLDVLAPGTVLIDRTWRILCICGDVDPYLTHKPGVPSDDLLEKARRGLRSKLRIAVQNALSQEQTVSVAARVQRDSAYHPVSITVRVIRDREQDENLALVMLEEEDRNPKRGRGAVTVTDARRDKRGKDEAEEGEWSTAEAPSLTRRVTMDEDLDDHVVIRQLEEELAATKDDLQATVEQLETSNEEFKASNEEVMSINEELQSTNEELETSKEELQSLNEELSTVNSQLAAKVEELETKHADLQNLLAATDVATICLDTDLAVRWFTPPVQQVIRLRESDRGRPLADFSHDFAGGDLAQIAEPVLKKLTPVEDEITCRDGRVYLRRVTPYRTDDHRIGGVVITFIDITERKHDEEARASLAAIVESSHDAIIGGTLDGTVTSWNRGAEKLFGFTAEEMIGQSIARIVPPNRQAELNDILQRLKRGESVDNYETIRRGKDGSPRDISLCVSPLANAQGNVIGACAIGRDISKQRAASEFIRLAIEASPVAALMIDPSGRIALVNSQTEQLFGYDRSELLGQAVETLIPERFRKQLAEDCTACVAGPEARPKSAGRELLGLRKDGREFPIEVTLSPVETPQGPHVRAAIADITQRKQAEAQLNQLNETLEEQVSQRTEMLKLLQDVTRSANEAQTVEEAMRAALQRISQYNGWQVGHVWRLADDHSGDVVHSDIWYVSDQAELAVGRLDDFRQICAQSRFSSGEILIGAVTQSGKPLWIDDIVNSKDWRRGDARKLGLHAAIAFPVTANGQVVAVLEFFSDHSARREERFMEIMPDVGIQLGHVIQRKRLEKLATDATDAEQRRIGSDIHDGVGQELTGLRYMAQTHAETLAEQSSPEVKTAQRMTDWLETVQRQLRGVVRKLVPVEIDEHGLVAALRRLAEQTTQVHDLDCRLECSPSIRVADATLATHIYRIAQEAVRNAVRHARPSKLRIALSVDGGVLKLQVADDGVGVKPISDREAGFGLRSMAYRASLIGAHFDCRPREEGGTRVTCTVPRGGVNNDEGPASDQI